MSAFLKWTAGILAVLAFLAWPYYSLYQLGRGITAGDAAAINRLVDWDSVRPSLKAQAQTLLAAMPGLTNQLANSASASVGAPSMAPVIANANTTMDAMLTPEGVEKMLKAVRGTAPADKNMASANMKLSARDVETLLGHVRFAFFVSPIHFRLDLGAKKGNDPTAVTVMMTFKGTGWQITDVKIPALDMLKSAQLDPARSIRAPAAAR